MTGIDIVIEIRKLLNVPEVTTLLGGGKVWQHNRPKNSEFTDVVISVPEYKGGVTDTGFVDINVHTPNLEDYYPITGKPEDNTFPDLAKLKQVTDAIIPRLESTGLVALQTTIVGVPIRDTGGHWYVNIRVAFELINPGVSIPVSLWREDSEPDGYGGVNVAIVQAWTGQGVKINVSTGSQLSDLAARYEFNQRCEWVLPIEANPTKNSQLHAPDGDYVIHGIRQNGIFWIITTVRKDGGN